jgi:acetoin utilization protein AcuB
MGENRIRRLPVVNDRTLVGIIADRDLRSFLSASLLSEPEARERALGGKISDVMTTNPLTISPDDDLQDAVGILLEEKIGDSPLFQSLLGHVMRNRRARKTFTRLSLS